MVRTREYNLTGSTQEITQKISCPSDEEVTSVTAKSFLNNFLVISCPLRFLTFFCLLLLPLFCSAQLKQNSAYLAYIDHYKDLAIEQMDRHHIPASITMAQGLLESGAGKSQLTTHGNNHFGIKCHNWTGDRMFIDDDNKDDCFRVYRNARESYEDHSLFLQQPRYSSLFALNMKDYKGWARGLKRCGYATNPQYANRLIDIIETYQLYKLDNGSAYDPFLAKHVGAASSYSGAIHDVKQYNKNYYVIVRQGDTFRSIGNEFDVSYRKLAKYNERDKRDVLHAGEILYLKKKRTRADKQFRNHPHVVRAGESMYDIAQRYGIRLKSLYKKNDLSPEYYTPKPGDRLVVY